MKDGKIILSFNHAGEGFNRDTGIEGLEVAGSDHVFVPADVEVNYNDKKTVILSAPSIAKNLKEAFHQSIMAGMDMHMHGIRLFENPYADEKETMNIRLNGRHRKTALEAARSSIVLLKNDGVLPLAGTFKNILVTGINANDCGTGRVYRDGGQFVEG